MSAQKKTAWFNPFTSHPALRALYYPAWFVAIIAGMTIVNSTARYDSMPPMDFVIALIVPVLLLLFRTKLSVDDGFIEYSEEGETAISSLSISQRVAGIPVRSSELLYDEMEINTTTKHPQIEFYRKGELVYQCPVSSRNKLSDLVLSLAPERVEELIDLAKKQPAQPTETLDPQN